MIICAVYDSKAEVFGNAYFAFNEPIARRMFSDVVNDPGSVVHRHPDDFVLFLVGDFDDVKGEIVGSLPNNLGVARSFLREVSSGASV